jgi:hypothetical protein
MKIWNENICITSKKSLITIFIVALCLCLLAFIADTEAPQPIVKCNEEIWIPTEDDIAYQDTMYSIIQSTQNDITNIKEDIVYIIERLDYEDGTHDSIRYVKGGKIDLRRN